MLYMSAEAADCSHEHEQGEHEDPGESGTTNAGAVDAHHQQQPPPGLTHQRSPGNYRGREQRAYGWRRAQDAKTFGPDVQDGLGENRKQRDCAPEEHGQQVQQDRAKQHAGPADEPQASQHAADIRRGRLLRPHRGRDRPVAYRALIMIADSDASRHMPADSR